MWHDQGEWVTSRQYSILGFTCPFKNTTFWSKFHLNRTSGCGDMNILWSLKTMKNIRICHLFKGCGMGPWLVLVSPCFKENEVATCKIGSLLCRLDNLLQKNVIVFFFGNQISKWRSLEKRVIFDLLFTFFSYQGKVTKIPSAHISLTYIHVFCSPYWLFCLTNFEKNTNLSGTVSLWYESWCWFLFAPFWNNQ